MANVQLAAAGTQVILSVPGVQGPAGSNLPPSGTTHQLLYKQSSTDYDTGWKLITNDNVDASAAIAGTKISPNFGSQNAVTTGTNTAASFIPTSSSVPANGLYLPSSNNVAISTNGAQAVVVNANGQIGIGGNGTGTNLGVYLQNGGGVSTHFYEASDGTKKMITGVDSTEDYIKIGSLSNHDLGLATNNGQKLRITSAGELKHIGGGSEGSPAVYFAGSAPSNSLYVEATTGNVGLGTSSPNKPLHIYSGTSDSEIRLQSNSGTEQNAYITLRNSDGKLDLYSVNGDIALNPGNNVAATFKADGKVGVGTTSPGYPLTVNGRISYAGAIGEGADTTLSSTSTTLIVGDSATWQNLSLKTNGDSRLYINSSGNVGVGITPVNTLDVNGTGRFRLGGNNLVITTDGGAPYLQSEQNAPLHFGTNAQLWATLDASGRLLVGTPSSYGVGSSAAAKIQTGDTTGGLAASFTSWSSFDDGGIIALGKAKGGSVGSYTIVANGDTLGQIRFAGADGSDLESLGALIQAQVDGTPAYASAALVNGQTYRIVTVTSSDWSAIGGPNPASVGDTFTATGGAAGLGTAILNAGNMPGRLVFSTTADGASSPTERMRITKQGVLKVSKNGSYLDVDSGVHEIRSNLDNNNVLIISSTASNGTQYGLSIRTADDQNDTTRDFLECRGGAVLRAQIRSNGAIANYSDLNVNLSDRNVKKDISPAADTWDCIKEWEIVNYRYKDQPDDADLNLGVIAQQVAESCPEVITVFEEAKDDQPEKLGVKEQQMMWMAIKALQEAQVRIETLEAEVAALKA